MGWIKGNETSLLNYCWLSLKGISSNVTYPYLSKYSSEKKCWIDVNSTEINSEGVIAYYPVEKPAAYKVKRTGYFIRTLWEQSDTPIDYGYGLKTIAYCDKGYDSIEKAKKAMKRLRKSDEIFSDMKMEIIDEDGVSVYRDY